MSFSQFSFDPRIADAIRQVGYTVPTPIQQQGIPVVLEGHDMLGLAQTGTGKTATFLLPMLQRLLSGRKGRIRALILAPTRELAEQIHQTAMDLGKATGARSISIYGGVGKHSQVGDLRRGAEIVVACPGRLLDHIDGGSINLSGVEMLVLDEADRMCDMGFLPEIRRILKYLPGPRQTLFFSATMPSDIRKLADGILRDPVTVQIEAAVPAKTVSHAFYSASQGHKYPLLLNVLKKTDTGRVLIFTRTKRRTRKLAADLKDQGYRVSGLQGNMVQTQRRRAIEGFRTGRFDILVATDVAARGIDVSEISHVINFDMPDSVDAYTHRIGRTGRAERTGEAFTFATHEDEPLVRKIEKVLKKGVEHRSLPEGMQKPRSSGERPGPGRVRRGRPRNHSGRGQGRRRTGTSQSQ
ncbi:MAG: DEAD/DEAH box helicase [Acidobacteriota bacterium]